MNKLIPLLAVAELVLALAPAAYAAPVTDPSLFTPVPTGPYRIAFVTTGTMQPTSSDISTYNTFVTTAAGLVTELKALGATWTCLGSTVAVSAKVNTSTDSTGDANDVPIYTTTGLRIAINNADLWDGTILNPIYFDDGTVAGVQGGAQEQTWTGTNPDGTSASSGDGRELGTGPSPNNIRLVRGGHTNAGWISGPSDHDASAKHYLALSDPITSSAFGVGRKPVYVLEGKIGLVRKWTSRKGTEVLAKLVSMKGDRAILYTLKQKQIAIRFDQLSREDQAYITEPLLTHSRSMIKPVAVTEDSGSYSKIASTARLIDSTGLAIELNTGDKIADTLPAFSGTYKDMWLSKSGAVEKQFIVFDLGGMFTVTDMYIWPYAMPNREQISVKEVALFVAESDTSQGLSARRLNWKQVRGPAGNTFFFPAAEKAHPAANGVKLPSPFHARYIMLDILSNHSEKETFVGMSKIRFAGWSLE